LVLGVKHKTGTAVVKVRAGLLGLGKLHGAELQQRKSQQGPACDRTARPDPRSQALKKTD
jgi:hypothetical protein